MLVLFYTGKSKYSWVRNFDIMISQKEIVIKNRLNLIFILYLFYIKKEPQSVVALHETGGNPLLSLDVTLTWSSFAIGFVNRSYSSKFNIKLLEVLSTVLFIVWRTKSLMDWASGSRMRVTTQWLLSLT